MYSFAFLWSVLQISVRSICFITSVSSPIYLLLSLWMTCLSVRVGYWRLPQSVCKNQYVIEDIVVFFGLPCIGAQILRTKMAFWIFFIDEYICPSQTVLINYGRKSILLDIKMLIPTCLLGLFAFYLFLKPFTLYHLSMMLRCVSWMHQREVPFFASILKVCVFLLEI